MALRLNRGDAPGLVTGRPLRDGTPRYRYSPGPSVRKRGFKAFYLLGAPGTAIADTPTGWAGLGFTTPPAGVTLTVDGPPLDLGAAITACRAITAAVRAQAEPAAPSVRPAVRVKLCNDYFDEFLDACRAGQVLKEQRGQGGRREPITPHTFATYRQGLTLLRPVIGADDPKALTRADLEASFETLIEVKGHHSAVRAQRSLSRAFNWLRRKDPAAAARLPHPEVYTQLRLGQPSGRLRLGTPRECQLMFDALTRPQFLIQELGYHPDDAPAAAPGAGAAWLFALWTCQRVNDTVSGATDHAVKGTHYTLRQSKTGRPIQVPILQPAREAIELARATRSGLGVRLPDNDVDRLLFWDSATRLPYKQIKGPDAAVPGQEYFKRLNNHWIAARKLAGLIEPSLLGHGLDPYGDPNKPLTLADSRDTSVTRLFEAIGTENEARLAEIAGWHGSSVENLLKLLKHYLVINPGFADRAGAAYERLAKANGFKV